MNLEPGLCARFDQSLQEIMPVPIALINVLFAVAATHDVVSTARILHSQLSRYGGDYFRF